MRSRTLSIFGGILRNTEIDEGTIGARDVGIRVKHKGSIRGIKRENTVYGLNRKRNPRESCAVTPKCDPR
jgi:hypothetical protein